jgi:hypothetical protein
MSKDRMILRKSSLLAPQPTRRRGIKERRLLTPEDSPYQNVALIDAEHGFDPRIICADHDGRFHTSWNHVVRRVNERRKS